MGPGWFGQTQPMMGPAHADGWFGPVVSSHSETGPQVSTGEDGTVNKTAAAW